MLLLVAWAPQQPMKTLKQWSKWFWIIFESLLEEDIVRHIVRLIPSKFYGYFRYKSAAAQMVPKLLNFDQKKRSMNIAQEMLTTFNDDPDLIQNVTNHRCMAMTLKPIIPMEAFRRAKTEKSMSSSVKCLIFAHCLLQLQWRGASWILAARSYGQ